MPDVVDPVTRSRMMAGIRGKNTRPELAIRKRLHALGYRYRLHPGDVPGKPDFVLPRYRAAVFVHGCFWHGHDCALFRIPGTRTDFWRSKIESNRARDVRVAMNLGAAHWRQLTIWECSFRGRGSITLEKVIDETVRWLASSEPTYEIRGTL
ncbi:very short patch repair endonuclease [Xanthobacter sp. AM33]|uniref:very short patch repair endonuclease n=1 Tax=Xanthobacter sp. AM33 TaxID=3380644 RepID=UPI0039BF5EFA